MGRASRIACPNDARALLETTTKRCKKLSSSVNGSERVGCRSNTREGRLQFILRGGPVQLAESPDRRRRATITAECGGGGAAERWRKMGFLISAWESWALHSPKPLNPAYPWLCAAVVSPRHSPSRTESGQLPLGGKRCIVVSARRHCSRRERGGLVVCRSSPMDCSAVVLKQLVMN